MLQFSALKNAKAFRRPVEISFKGRLVLHHDLDGSLALKFFLRAAPEGYLLYK